MTKLIPPNVFPSSTTAQVANAHPDTTKEGAIITTYVQGENANANHSQNNLWKETIFLQSAASRRFGKTY